MNIEMLLMDKDEKLEMLQKRKTNYQKKRQEMEVDKVKLEDNLNQKN